MMFLHFSFLSLVLYLWTLGTGVGPSSNWCGALLMISVSSGIMYGDFCGGGLVAWPGVINIE